MSLNKKNFSMLMIPLIIIILMIVYFNFFYQRTYAGIKWPQSTEFDTSGDSVAITLHEKFEAFHGLWPNETMFFVAQNEIREIEVFSDFQFLDFQFKKGAAIELTGQAIQMYIKGNYKIDGMELDQECLLKFSNRVLISAHCPNQEEISFKRFIKPESLEFELEGDVKEVE